MFYDGSGAVPVVLYQTNVMSLMLYSELRGHFDRMALVDYSSIVLSING